MAWTRVPCQPEESERQIKERVQKKEQREKEKVEREKKRIFSMRRGRKDRAKVLA